MGAAVADSNDVTWEAILWILLLWGGPSGFFPRRMHFKNNNNNDDKKEMEISIFLVMNIQERVWQRGCYAIMSYQILYLGVWI